ncbi:Uma2 family endonuclease [Nocardia cyriacigeorgica]|uniref:Uma2 family endonuclease n=1 Tax=Nocardia cyriacigeorgica TaxID=135487 RepID=UPI001E5BD576|nr:Uma2 family endonuclease [Nocardia cyriacigeorgica]
MTVPSASRTDRPDLPEYMTWEELEKLPEEIADQIELWDRRVVWLRRGPGEHQLATLLLAQEIRSCAGDDRASHPERCWRGNLETNVFFGTTGKSDFVTPDFLVHRCLPPGADVRATDTVLVGEVLSPSNTPGDVEAKKARYAGAGIPSYWEVDLKPDLTGIGAIRVYILEIGHAELPSGVRPLRSSNYLLAGEWTPDSADGVSFPYPFPIEISWSALAF